MALWRLVEGLDLASEVTINSRPYPGVCLVEDGSGVIGLICPVGLATHLWNLAQDRCGMVIMYSDLGWVHLERDAYALLRQQYPDGVFPEEMLWAAVTAMEPIDYPAFVAAQEHLEVQRKLDALKEGFVNVHTHTEFSALDGLTTMDELIGLARKYNQPGICLTDHGTNAGQPELIQKCSAADLIPVCGQEAYFVFDRFAREKEDLLNYYHLILWAENEAGLKNLWGASTEANRSGFYGRPRMDWQVLRERSEGLLASTACLRGPFKALLMDGKLEAADAILGRFLTIFPDRLWIELGTNGMDDQKELNKLLVEFARRHGLPLIAAVDSHYPCAEDYELHQLWLKAQTTGHKGDSASDDSGLFSGEQPYHIMTRAEVRRALDYLPGDAVEEAIEQTVELCHRIQPYNLLKADPPIFDVKKGRHYALETLVDLCMKNWQRKILSRPRTKEESVYVERFEYEMGILIKKQFVDYYCIVSDYVRWAKRNGILVGPGRGSGSASLVAFLADITEVDPVENDLPFARFITEDRVDPPDFDIDFPASKREAVQHYIAGRWGIDYVARVGTHIRLKNKGAIRDAARVLSLEMPKNFFADVDEICKIIEMEESDSAGLGKPWEMVMTSTEEVMKPYMERWPKLFDTAERLVLRLKSYGKHAAGMVISTGTPLTGRLPMRQGDADQMVAEFDFPALEVMGLLKFDILTLRTLDTLQTAIDLIAERRGVTINFYDWTHEYDDPQVWESISDGETLGVFQFETRAMTRMVKRYRPTSILNLADINSLVRPGPSRSGMTELYFRRREGQEEVSYPHPDLEPILRPTYGIVVYQEQVMRICQTLAGFTDVEANKVRSVMGKKKVDQVEAQGIKFVDGCLANGVDEALARGLWDQMAEFGKYGFSICHAYPYSMLGFYCAWLRVHYPEEFFTAVLSTVDKDRVPEFVGECQRLGYNVLPPDINLSRQGFTPGDMAVRYGLLAVPGVGEKTVEAILERQPFTSYEDFRTRVKGSACDIGVVKTLAAVGALDSLYPNRKELELLLAQETDGTAETCKFKDLDYLNEYNLPCHYDWANEPVTLTKAGKAQKRKDPPKRCTKGCRHYDPQGSQIGEVKPYTEAEIRDREMELLGSWLSYSPFDRVPPDLWYQGGTEATQEQVHTGEQIESAVNGTYRTAAVLREIKYKTDKAGNPYAFLEIMAKNAVLSVIVFSSNWPSYKHKFHPNKLGIYEILKTPNGYQLKGFTPVPD